MTDFEKLFNENREFIFKYLMKMTRDITLSEELTQETFFRAYMNYASLKNKEKCWLKGILSALLFAVLSFVVFSLLANSFNWAGFGIDLAIDAVVGAIAGIICGLRK